MRFSNWLLSLRSSLRTGLRYRRGLRSQPPRGSCDTRIAGKRFGPELLEDRLVLTAPVASDGTLTVDFGQTGGGTLVATDEDYDWLTYAVGSPSHGSAGISENYYWYMPNQGFSGTDSFSFTVDDGNGGSDTATITVAVLPNQPPLAWDGAVTVQSGHTISGTMMASDQNGHWLTYSVGSTAHGSVGNSENTFWYTPSVGFSGVDTFTFTAADGFGGTDTGIITVTVLPNHAPMPDNGSVTVRAGQHATGTLSATDQDGDWLIYTVGSAAHGSVWGNGADFWYAPNAGYSGQDSFDFLVDDGLGGTATGTIVVTVLPNHAPIASDGSATVPFGQPSISGTLWATDEDSDSLTFTVGSANHGWVWSYGAQYWYSPEIGYTGPDSFEFTVDDGLGGSDTGVINVTVFGSDLAPNQVPEVINLRLVNNTGNPADSVTTDGKIGGQVTHGDGGVSGLPIQYDYSQDGMPDGVVYTDYSESGLFVIDLNEYLTRPQAVTVQVRAGEWNSAEGDYAYGEWELITFSLVTHENVPPEAVADQFVVEASSNPALLNVTRNDRDPDGTVVTVVQLSSAQHGTVSVASGGLGVQYVPTPGFTGSDTFVYTLQDSNGAQRTATVSVVVHAPDDTIATSRSVPASPSHDEVAAGLVADGPQASLDVDVFRVELTSGQRLTLDLDAHDPVSGFAWSSLDGYLRVFDQAGDELIAADDPPNGSGTQLDPRLTFVAPSTGSYFVGVSAFPNINYDGHLAASGQSGSAGEYRLGFHVVDNQVPTAASDSKIVNQGAVVSIGVLANDSDADGDALLISNLTPPASGSVVVEDNGTLTYEPDDGFFGADSFLYTVEDPYGASAIASVTVIVNARPDAQDDVKLLSEDVPAVISVLANDSDPDGSILEVNAATQGSHGTVVRNANGTITYSPALNYYGPDEFQYTVSDGLGATQTATVSLVIQPVNDAPLGVADQFAVVAGGQLIAGGQGVLSNDVDAEGSSLAAILQSGPEHGALTFAEDGSFGYAPTPGFLGDDSFTYRASDGVLSGAPVTVTIHVIPPTPVSNSDAYYVGHGGILDVGPGGVLANDYSPIALPLSAVLIQAPQHGTLILNANGSLTYVPTDRSFVGVDSFCYRATDGFIQSSDATVLLHVENDAPVGNADAYQVRHDANLTISAAQGVVVNDQDDVGEILEAVLDAGPQHGTLALNADGSFSYAPASGFVGADSFTYKVGDGAEWSSPTTVTISVWNNVPVAVADQYTGLHDRIVNISGSLGILHNDDTDNGETLSVQLMSTTKFGSLVVQPSGAFVYYPDYGFVGEDQFTYRVFDGVAYSSPATVQLHTTNSQPTAADDSYVVQAGTDFTVAASGGVLANDSDDAGDIARVLLVSNAAHGELDLNEDGSFTYEPASGFVGVDSFRYSFSDGLLASKVATVEIEVVGQSLRAKSDYFSVVRNQPLHVGVDDGVTSNDWHSSGMPMTTVLLQSTAHGQLQLAADGSFEYVPTAGFMGEDTFRYSATDGTHTSAATVVSIRVFNHTPQANDDYYEVQRGQTLQIPAIEGLLANDFDEDALAIEVVATPTHGSLFLAAGGMFQYVPAAGYEGTDAFTYRVGDGVEYSETAKVRIRVSNTAPVAREDVYRIRHDDTLTISADGGVLANDTDSPLQIVTAAIETQPSHGSITLAGDGSFVYVPASGFSGTDSFSYRASDGYSSSDGTKVTLYVANEEPTVLEPVFSVLHDHPLLVSTARGLLAGSRDLDGDLLSVALVSAPNHGTVAIQPSGGFSYFPSAGFSGKDTFTFTVSDGGPAVGPFTAAIEVRNTAPRAVGKATSMRPGTLTRNAAQGLLANDRDADGDDLDVILVSGPDQGLLTLDSETGAFSYVSAAGFSGTVTISYRVSDGAGVSDLIRAAIAVTNNPPVGAEDRYEVHHGTKLSVAAAVGLLRNDRDVDGDALMAAVVSQPSHGVVAVSTNGSFVYQPSAGYVGIDQFTYRISDGFVTSQPVTVVVDVMNRLPVAVGDSYRISHDRTLAVNAQSGVLANDRDPDDLLTVSLEEGVQHGDLVLQQDGSFVYTPDAKYAGLDFFTYTVFDGAHTVEPLTVTIDVTNSAPGGSDRFETVRHDRVLSVGAGRGLLSATFDADGDTRQFSIVQSPAHGALVTYPDGSYQYTPAIGFVGTDVITYTLSDGVAASREIEVRLAVSNADALVRGDEYFVPHNQSLNVSGAGVLANDADADGDTLNAELVSSPTRGSLVLQSNGGFAYTPETGFSGTDTFTYRAHDGVGVGHVARVILRVAAAGVGPGVDNDGDGIADSVENAGPQSGDANGDGVVDRLQPNVASFPDAVTGDYVRLTTPVGTSLQNVSSQHWLDVGTLPVWLLPGGGAVTFEVRGVTPGGSVAVNVTGWSGFEKYFQFGPTPDQSTAHWYDFSYDSVSGTGAKFHGGGLTLHFVDGLRGDHDLAANGVIVDPGMGGSATVNNVPVAASDSYRVHHDSTLSVTAEWGLLINDSSDAGESLTPVLVSSPSHGSVTISGSGAFVYVPDAGYVGADFFEYQVGDGAFVSAKARVSLDVWNQGPNARPDHFRAHHDRPLSVFSANGLLINDWNDDGDVLIVTGATQPAQGSVATAADGSFTYTPNAGYVGSDSFQYSVSDGVSTSTQTVTIEVENLTPQANDDVYRVHHGSTLVVTSSSGILANDWDGDALDSLSFSVDTSSLAGALSVSANGGLTYVPPTGFVGVESFVYTLTDGTQSGTVSASVTIEVWNNSPIGASADYEVNHNSSVTIPLAGADWDGDSLSFTTTPPSHGVLALSGSFVVYQPSSGFSGDDSFTYRVWDGAAYSAAKSVNVHVLNFAPVAVDDYHSYTVSASNAGPTSATFSLTANDYDADVADSKTIQIVSGPSRGSIAVAGGSVTYTPSLNQPSGVKIGVDTFSYRIFDGVAWSAPATATINAKNSTPSGRSDLFSVRHGSGPFTFNVASNDGDAEGDPLTYTLLTGSQNVTLSSGGQVTFTPPNAAATTNPAAPAKDYTGVFSFLYTVSDGVTTSPPVSVTIDVTNRFPLALRDNYATPVGTTVTTTVLVNDSDADGDSIRAFVTRLPTNGKLSVSGTEVNADGEIASGIATYTPNPGYIGEDRFWYRIYDGVTYSAEVPVTFHVWDHDRIAQDDYYRILQTATGVSTSVSVGAGVLANDWDSAGGALTATLVGSSTSGPVTWSLNPDGSFSLSCSDTNFTGDVTFQYRIGDASFWTYGGAAPVATVTFHVVALTPTDMAITGLHDRPILGDLITGDSSGASGEPLRASLQQSVSNGTLYLYSNGSFTYLPSPGFVGVDSFTYTTTNGWETTPDAKTVTFTITNGNPTASADVFTVAHNGILEGSVVANDADPDSTDRLRVSLQGGTSNGTLILNPDGTFIYVPATNWAGTDGFSYTVTDGAWVSQPVAVSIAVTNEAPTAFNRSYELVHDRSLTVTRSSGLVGDSLHAGCLRDTHSAVNVGSGTGGGALSVNSDGSFTYTPAPGFVGSDVFQYQLSDNVAGNVGVSSPATVTFVVKNFVPAPTSGTARVNAQSPLVWQLPAVDGDGDQLTYQILYSPPSHTGGAAVLSSSGLVNYIGAPSVTPYTDHLTYRVMESGTGKWSDPATITLDVSGSPWILWNSGDPVDWSVDNNGIRVSPLPGSTRIEFQLGVDWSGGTPDQPGHVSWDDNGQHIESLSIHNYEGSIFLNGGAGATVSGDVHIFADADVVGDLVAGMITDFDIGGSAGRLTSKGDIVDINIGGDATKLEAQRDIWSAGVGGRLTEGASVGRNIVYLGIGSVPGGAGGINVGGSIGSLHIWGDLNAPVTAKGQIGGIIPVPAGQTGWYWNEYGQELSVLGNLTSSVIAGGSIASVTVGKSMIGATIEGSSVGSVMIKGGTANSRVIALGGDVDSVRVRESASKLTVMGGSVGSVRAEYELDGEVTASVGQIGSIQATFGELSGKWQAQAGLPSISAWSISGGTSLTTSAGNIAANVAQDTEGVFTALHGDITISANGKMGGKIDAKTIGRAAAKDISADIHASLLIGSVLAGNSLSGSEIKSDNGSIGTISGVTVSRDISALNGTVSLVIGNTVQSKVSAAAVVEVRGSWGVTGEIKAGAGGIQVVTTRGPLSSGIVSTGPVTFIQAGGDIAGDVIVTGSTLGQLRAGSDDRPNAHPRGSITGLNVSATAGIGSVYAGRWGGIGGDISAVVTAEFGHIQLVSAGNTISGEISAKSVEQVVAGDLGFGEGNILKSITSTAWNIGTVKAANGRISGKIDSVGAIGNVLAGKSIAEVVSAGTTIGTVTALDGSILKDVTTTTGNIGTVSAGVDIMGQVKSGKDITTVVAGTAGNGGQIAKKVSALNGVIDSVIALGPQGYWAPLVPAASSRSPRHAPMPGLPGNGVAPKLSRSGPQGLGTSGLAKGVEAKEIGKIQIAGSVADAALITADRIGSIWTQGVLGGTVSFTAGLLQVDSWGGTTEKALFTGGAGQNSGSVRLKTFDQALGKILNTKSATVSSWGIVDMENTVLAGLGVVGYDAVSGIADSLNSAVAVVTSGSMRAQVKGWKEVTVSALNILSYNIKSATKDASAWAWDKFIGQLDAFGYAVALGINELQVNVPNAKYFYGLSFGKVTNSSVSTSKSLALYAIGDVDGTFTSTGSTFVEGANIQGTITAGTTAEVNAWGTLDGEVNGNSGVKMFAHGDIKKAVTSSSGKVEITTSGNIDGEVTAQKNVVIDAFGKINKNVASSDEGVSISAAGLKLGTTVSGETGVEIESWGTVGSNVNSKKGAIAIFAAGDVDGEIEALGDVAVDTWGKLKKSVTGGGASLTDAENAEVNVTITALGDIEEAAKIESGGNVSVQSWGNILSEITAKQGTVSIDAFGDVNGDVSGKLSVEVQSWSQIGSGPEALFIRSLTGSATTSSYGDTSATITGGTSATVTAGGVFEGTITSKRGDAFLSALGGTSGTTSVIAHEGNASVEAGADTLEITVQAMSVPSQGDSPWGASVSAQGSVSGSISSHGSVSIFSGGGVNVTATATTGAIVAASHGDLEGKYEAGSNLSTSAVGTVKGSYTAGGWGSIDTLGRIDTGATIEAKLDLDVFAKGSIEASLIESTSGSVSVLAGGRINSVVIGDNDATATTMGDIHQAVAATRGSAHVVSRGAMNAQVTGNLSVDVATSGDVNAFVMSSSGPVSIVAKGKLNAIVQASTHASVAALDDVNGMIITGADAEVVTLGKLSGSVQAGRDAYVVTHSELSGSVTADHNASVVTFAAMNGSVSAVNDVDVYVTDETAGSVSAGNDAVLWSYGEISGTATAGRNAEVTTWNELSGPVTAGGNADVWAYGQVNSAVSAGANASTTSWAAVNSVTTAGNDAFVTVYGTFGPGGAAIAGSNASVSAYGVLQGPVTAGEDAFAWSMGKLTGIVSAGGDATVESMDGITNTITAGGAASIWGIGAIQSMVNADSIDLTGHSSVVGSYSAVSGVEVFTLGAVSGSVSASAGDVNLSALGMAGPLSVTGNNVSILADSVNGVAATANTGSASLIGFGTLNNSTVSAPNGRASASTLGSVVLVSLSGDITELSAFGSVAGAFLTADEFASLFAGGTVSLASVTASTGSATALVQGTVGGGFTMTAGVDAVLSGLSTIAAATLTAGQSAAVFSVGNATATLSAPEIVQGVSYGTLDLTVSSTPKLLEVMSTGTLSLTGSADTAAIATYGDYSVGSSVTVSQLPMLWVMGDLAGSVTADQIRNVRVFGHLTGTVIETGATPVTGGPAVPLEGGISVSDGDGGSSYYSYSLVTPLDLGNTSHVGIQVLHDITQSATVALTSPIPVVVGGTVSGVVTAFVVREGDRSSFLLQPEVPTPAVGGLIAEIRDEARSLADSQQELVEAGQSLVAATTAALAELTNMLASSQAEVSTAQMDALEEMLSLKVEETVRLAASISGADRELANAQQEIEAASRRAAGAMLIELQTLADALAERQAELIEGYGAAAAEKTIASQLAGLTALAHADGVTREIAVWNGIKAQRPYALAAAVDQVLRELVPILKDLALDGVQFGLSILGGEQTVLGLVANILDAGISFARGDNLGGTVSLVSAAPMLGAGADAVGIPRAFARVSKTFGRIRNTITHAFQTVNRAIHCEAGSRVLRTMGKILGRCFVGDTLVLVGEFEPGQTIVVVDAGISTEQPLVTSESSDSRWAGLMWLAVGLAGVVVLKDRERNSVPALRPPKRSRRGEAMSDPPDEPLPPQLTSAELDALCDELFGVPLHHPAESRLEVVSPAIPSASSGEHAGDAAFDGPLLSRSNTLAVIEEPIMQTRPEVAASAKTKERRGGVRSLLAGMWGAFFGILALWTVWGSPVDIGSQPTASKPAVAVAAEPQSPNQPVREASQPQFAGKAIRDIFPIADRVIARNPEEELSPFDAADFELASLSEEELAELDTELLETLEDEPLPALIDGIPDDSELLVVDAESTLNTSTANNERDDTSFARAEELYDRLADAALVSDANSSDAHAESTDYGPFVREHWRVIRFRLTRPDGDQVRIWLARPAWWLAAEQVHAGGKYEFDMEEVGAVGFADVLSIDECPEPPRRQNADHHLVTGKFEHDATNVINLYVAGEDDPIGTTANHPFWSDDRQAFVEAATLRPGEHLINAKGERVRVITHSPRPGPHTVYNLEVDGEHVYLASNGGLLVHNNYVRPTFSMSERARRYQAQITRRAKEWLQNGVFFDGKQGNILLEVKGLYAHLLRDPAKLFSIGNRWLRQAKRQLDGLEKGQRLRWVFAEKSTADMARRMFQRKGFPIDVLHIPMKLK